MIIAPSPELCAYTAGMVDGEGSIQINATKSSNTSKKAYWNPTVQVSSVAIEFLTDLRNDWRHLVPYLRLKRQHAELLIEFRQYVSPKRDSITPEMSEHRRRIADAIRDLNARTGKATAKPRANVPL